MAWNLKNDHIVVKNTLSGVLALISRSLLINLWSTLPFKSSSKYVVSKWYRMTLYGLYHLNSNLCLLLCCTNIYWPTGIGSYLFLLIFSFCIFLALIALSSKTSLVINQAFWKLAIVFSWSKEIVVSISKSQRWLSSEDM